jgi:tripartite-type tricarboxylate transporter receptor subunit TctC
MIDIRGRALGLAAALLIACLPAAHAADWPTRPIRIIVPYAPGGIGDILARMIAPVLQDALHESIFVENKTGASGSLGTEYVARAAPDGYTLLLGLAAPQTLNQYVYKVNYDGVKDFAPITLINTNPMVLMVNPALPVHDVKELIALAKQKPGQLFFSDAGGLTQFSGEIFKYMADVKLSHVTYRGGAPAVMAAAAGDTQITFANYSDALTWMKSGKLRPIALTSAKRFPQSPEIPTIAESGVPGYDVQGWSALLAPAGTPPEIIEKIYKPLAAAFQDPAMRAKMEAIGAEPGGSTPAEFGRFMAQEQERWKSFVEKTGIKVEQ